MNHTPIKGNEMTTEIEDIKAKIKEVASEEAYENIIRTAATESDEVDYLTRVWGHLRKTVDNGEHGLPDGFTVLKVPKNESAGWIVRETGDEVFPKEFIGLNGRKAKHSHLVSPWSSLEDGATWVREHLIPSMSRKREEKPFEVVSTTLPFITQEKPERGYQLKLQLDETQTQRIQGYREGLRQQNACLADGSPVKSNVDVIRFWLGK